MGENNLPARSNRVIRNTVPLAAPGSENEWHGEWVVGMVRTYFDELSHPESRFAKESLVETASLYKHVLSLMSPSAGLRLLLEGARTR